MLIALINFFLFFTDNVGSLAMGKTARRSIESPSSPTSSAYLFTREEETTTPTAGYTRAKSNNNDVHLATALRCVDLYMTAIMK